MPICCAALACHTEDPLWKDADPDIPILKQAGGVREIATVAFVSFGVREHIQMTGTFWVHVSFMSYGNVLNHHDLVATRCSNAS
jgi:hypothetical protein